jgi:hypothetical protein
MENNSQNNSTSILVATFSSFNTNIQIRFHSINSISNEIYIDLLPREEAISNLE